MPKSQSSQELLARAKEREKKYAWLEAAEIYGQASAIPSVKSDPLQSGVIQERIGYCLQRAAQQASKQEDFGERIRRAVSAYKKARRSYGKTLDKQGTARGLRCEAQTRYLEYWLSPDPAEKRRLLDQCLELENSALTEFVELGEPQEYVRTYSGLWLVFFCRVFLEWDRQTLKSVLDRGVEWGEKAIKHLARTGDLTDTAGAYLAVATCLSDAGYYLIAESEEIERYRSKAVRYLQEAVKLSEKAGDALLSGLSHVWWGINSGEKEAIEHHKEALRYGKQTRDNFLIAGSLGYMAYSNYWMALAEESPEKRAELTKKAMQFYGTSQKHYSLISFMSPRGGLIGPPSGLAEHYYQQALWETDIKKRSECLQKAEKLVMRSLDLAKKTDMPMVLFQVFHVASKILQAQAVAETSRARKRSLLGKALEYRVRTVEIGDRLAPFFYWNRGVMQNYLSGIKAELAEIETNMDDKRRLLEEAARSKQECLRLCNRVMPDLERKGETSLFSALQRYQDNYATLLIRLYEITGRAEHPRKAIEALQDAINSAAKLDMASLIAESYWKIARAQDVLGENWTSARSFEQAAENYSKAAEKIPPLRDFYQDHATYMKAWSEIEKARHNHSEKRYGQAERHYEKAASFHKTTERWSYFSSNYLAWARLEAAENLSREEQIQEAIQLFREARRLFKEAKMTLQDASDKIDTPDEKNLAERLAKALEIRRDYCKGRITVEQAKILSRQGDNATSSKRYGEAARKFQAVMDTIEHEPRFTSATIAKDRQELMPIITLCKAWQMMTKAEAEASPELYLKASKLFDKAKEYSVNQESKLMALGHSNFCKALNAGARFEDSGDEELYLAATKHLETAAGHYARAGLKTASEYAIATQRLFDAYMYMTNAKEETSPGKKARYYTAAEKVLQSSIGAYVKAKHPVRSEQVQRLLEKVREERKLATSLSEILTAPHVTSSTASFVTPTPSEESAVGLERFESANIQASLTPPVDKVGVGEEFNLDVQIANVGKKTVLLASIGDLLPPDFDVVTAPDYCSFENTWLDMKGKRLNPQGTLDIGLRLRSLRKGAFQIRPRIIYVDETGQQATSETKPAKVEVTRIVLPDRMSTGHEDFDNLLYGGIPQGSAIILTAPSYDERDLLIRRFVENGVRTGQITFHISTKVTGLEQLAREFQSNFSLFICNPQADKIIENLPNVFKLKGIENLTDVNIALTSAFRKLDKPSKQPRRMCIEIVSDILLQHHAVNARRWLNAVIPDFRAKGFTTLAVINAQMHPLRETKAVLDIFDGEIDLFEKKKGKMKPTKYLKVKKLSNHQYLEGDFPVRKKR